MARRGRKRQPGKPRTATGRISDRRKDRAALREKSRAETEVAAQATALAARARLHGVAEASLKDQRAGSVVGLMTIAGMLSDRHYEAAMEYVRIRSRALLAIGAPDVPREPAPDGIKAYTGCGCVDVCQGAVAPHPCERRTALAARQRLSDADAAIWVKQGRILAKADVAPHEGELEQAISVIVLGDQSAPHLETALRHALNALHELFTGGRRQAAA